MFVLVWDRLAFVETAAPCCIRQKFVVQEQRLAILAFCQQVFIGGSKQEKRAASSHDQFIIIIAQDKKHTFIIISNYSIIILVV